MLMQANISCSGDINWDILKRLIKCVYKYNIKYLFSVAPYVHAYSASKSPYLIWAGFV
jgi:hypothetical protein